MWSEKAKRVRSEFDNGKRGESRGSEMLKPLLRCERDSAKESIAAHSASWPEWREES